MRKIIQGFNRFLFYLAAVPLFLIMILTDIDVTGRYFRNPLPGAFELSTVFLALICAWCWAHTQAKRGHISIDLLLKTFPGRAQVITNIATSFIALVITSLIAWQTVNFTMLARRLMDWTNILKLPIWPFKAMMLLGLLCLALQFILDIIDHFKELRRQTIAARAAGTGVQGTGGTGID